MNKIHHLYGGKHEKQARSFNNLTQSACVQACSVLSPFTPFVITVIVLVPVFLLYRELLSNVAHRLFYLIGSTSCLWTDNCISQVLIYFLGTRLEPFSHNLAVFTSLHLWTRVLHSCLSQRLMDSFQCGVSFIVRVFLIKCMFQCNMERKTIKDGLYLYGNILWVQTIDHQYAAFREPLCAGFHFQQLFTWVPL